MTRALSWPRVDGAFRPDPHAVSAATAVATHTQRRHARRDDIALLLPWLTGSLSMRSCMRTRSVSSVAVLFLLSVAAAGAQRGAVFAPEDMLAVRTFAGGQTFAVSSTGRWIAYTL